MKKFLSIFLSLIILFNVVSTEHYAEAFSFKKAAIEIFLNKMYLDKCDELIIERAISIEYDLPAYKDFLEAKKATAVWRHFLYTGFISGTEVLMNILTSNEKINVTFARELIRFVAARRNERTIKRNSSGVRFY